MPPPVPVLLLVRELNLGGTERQLTETALGLGTYGFQPHVGCFRPAGIRGDELRAAGIPIIHLPVYSFRSPAVFTAARQLGRYLRDRHIPLVHTFDVPLNLYGVLAARYLRAPIVLSSQRAHRELTPGLTRHLLRLTDLLADGIVVNCEAMRHHLIEDEHVPRERVNLCYNAIDTERFSPAPEQPRPPELADATLTIGVVCALRPEKDLPTLLRAFAAVRHVRPGIRLVIVGDGPEREPLGTLARELGIVAETVFIPGTNEVSRWLRALDIFVLPSRSEALSNALLEAMASACVPVASRVGGNPELVTDGVTGRLFRAGDPFDLANQLRQLISDDVERRRLSTAARQATVERFSRAASLSQMASIYRRYLSSSSR